MLCHQSAPQEGRTAFRILSQLQAANKNAVLASLQAEDAIQSSVQSLASQEEVLQNMQARLRELGLPTQLRSLQALTQGLGRSLITVLDDEGGVSKPTSRQKSRPSLSASSSCMQVSGLSPQHLSEHNAVVSGTRCSSGQATLMQLSPSPPPSDVYIFSGTPRSGASTRNSLPATPTTLSNQLSFDPGPSSGVKFELSERPVFTRNRGHGTEAHGANSHTERSATPTDADGGALSAADEVLAAGARQKVECPESLLSDMDLHYRVVSMQFSPLTLQTQPGLRKRSKSLDAVPKGVESYMRILSFDVEHLNPVQVTRSEWRATTSVDRLSSGELTPEASPPLHSAPSKAEPSPTFADAMVEVELEATLQRWMNFELESRGVEVRFTDLKAEIQAGAKLIQFICACIPGVEAQEFCIDPKTGAQWRANVATAFGMLERASARRPQWTVNGLVLGKRRAVLEFCWGLAEAVLSRRLAAGLGASLQQTAADGTLVIHRAELLRWIRDRIPDCPPAADFSATWTDGALLQQLVGALCPEAVGRRGDDDGGPLGRVAGAMQAATEGLGIPRLIQETQVLTGREQAILLYVAEVVAASTAPRRPV